MITILNKEIIPRYHFLLLLGVFLFSNTLSAQDKLKQEDLPIIQGHWLRFSDASNSLYHYLAAQSFDLLDKRADQVAALVSLSDWKERQQSLRKTLNDIVGPFPEKTPLQAKVVKTVNKADYKMEQVIYESQPAFYVTSSIFIPNGLKGKAPAIIYCSGHSADGYRGAVYQHVILNLVKKGFIVLAFDPVGQGERLQYFDPTTGKSTVGGPTHEHSYPGAQAFVAGNSQARYMIWDGIRSVDYLLSRKEVDPDRIGITGRSGGGTQSAYIAAFDERIKAVAPENYITSFTRLFESVGPQDAEQNFFNGIKRGIDHADLLEVRAPKPALMITTTRDAFSIQGARETAKEVARVYQVYGKEDNFGIVEDDAPHASTLKNREAMYAFFQKALNNPGSSKDEDPELLSSDEIRVTQTGQVSSSLGGETVFSLNRKESEKRMRKLQSFREDLSTDFLSTVVASAKRLSGYEEPKEMTNPVFTGRFQREGYVIEKYFVKGEGDYPIPYLLVKPERPNHKALLYLNPLGKSVEALAGGEIEWFVKKGYTVLAPDLVGMGEMGPGDFRGDAYIGNTSFNIWFASIQIGRSIVGIQAGDLVRLTRMLHEDTAITEIYGFAREQAAPVLLHAAAFEPLIERIALIEPYSSYRSIVMNKSYNPVFIPATVPGAIGVYDLPDLAASLAPRKLMVEGMVDGAGNHNSSEIAKDQLVIRAGYGKRNAEDYLTIIPRQSAEELHNFYESWIK